MISETSYRDQVLIVENDLATLAILHGILEDAGYTATGANKAEVAIGWIQRPTTHFDFLIVDTHLPYQKGFTYVHVIDQMKLKSAKTGVIVTMGVPLEDPEHEVFHTGTIAFINKPYKAERILRMLKALKRASAE